VLFSCTQLFRDGKIDVIGRNREIEAGPVYEEENHLVDGGVYPAPNVAGVGTHGVGGAGPLGAEVAARASVGELDAREKEPWVKTSSAPILVAARVHNTPGSRQRL